MSRSITMRGLRRGAWTVLLALLFSTPLMAAAQSPDLPVIATLPEFSLVDQDGRPFNRSNLEGSTWVVDFVFTRCSGPCPAMNQRMRDLSTRMTGVPGVRFLTITVDPKNDTAAVLKKFSADLGAPKHRWVFATGGTEAVWTLSRKGFLLSAGPNADAATDPSLMPFLHSTRFVLVDSMARIRGFFEGPDEAAVATLEGHARHLAESGELSGRFPTGLAAVLPAVNASFNALAALFILLGWVAIRRGQRDSHRRLMLSAVVVSCLFLTTYVTHHALHGSSRFAGQGWIRPVYYGILLTHTVLAVLVLPLVIITVRRGLAGLLIEHRAIARFTLPVWLYVSVTGVTLYWLVYQVYGVL